MGVFQQSPGGYPSKARSVNPRLLTFRANLHILKDAILCQEDAYLLELVRYIHLNPIRAGIVKELEGLDRYPFSGHSTLLGKIPREWQDTGSILGSYGERIGTARRRYRAFIFEGTSQGRRPELTGGGLIRSPEGWEEVKRMREAREFQKSDERILGDGDFVEEVLSACDEKMERRYRLRARDMILRRPSCEFLR